MLNNILPSFISEHIISKSKYSAHWHRQLIRIFEPDTRAHISEPVISAIATPTYTAILRMLCDMSVKYIITDTTKITNTEIMILARSPFKIPLNDNIKTSSYNLFLYKYMRRQ